MAAGALLSARSQGVRRAWDRPGVPWWTQKRALGHWLGPGNTNVAREGSTQVAWLGTTRYSTLPGTRYTTLPVPHPVYHPPGTHPASAVWTRPKEILGVDNAQCTCGLVTGPACAVPAPPSPYAHALGPSLCAYSVINLSISQYISVFLSS